MYEAKNGAKLRSWTPTMATTVNTAIPTKTTSVTLAPPTLSDSQPPTGRATEPISAPMKPSPAR